MERDQSVCKNIQVEDKKYTSMGHKGEDPHSVQTFLLCATNEWMAWILMNLHDSLIGQCS